MTRNASDALAGGSPTGASGATHGHRLDVARVDPSAFQPLLQLEGYVHRSGLERPLIELVRLRASVLNGCAFCVDMHTKDARRAGETEQRLYAVPVWRDTPFFTERERAALAWTEAVTDLPRTGVPDDVYETVRAQFGDRELVALTLAIIAINGWNRLNVSFRRPAGDYVPGSIPEPR